MFFIFCIMGIYFGLYIEDLIVNICVIGVVMGGLFGGLVVGGLVGLIGGLYWYFMGGMMVLSCMIFIIVEGLLGGLVYSVFICCGCLDKVFSLLMVGVIMCVVELVQMLIILLIVRLFNDVLYLVSNIVVLMMVMNIVGVVLFMCILFDKCVMFEKYILVFFVIVLKVVVLMEGILCQGFNEVNSMKVVQVLYQELDIGVVVIIDCEKLLVFIGIGDDYYLLGKFILLGYMLKVIEIGEVVYVDGNEVLYCCLLYLQCKFGLMLVILLCGENQ